jgi:tetratricopeptide (TPR) repeat protein
MAIVYEEEEKYDEALQYYEKSFTNLENFLPDGHRYLALERYERCLQIRLRSLPPDHPRVGATYRNMELLFEKCMNLIERLRICKKHRRFITMLLHRIM